MRSLCDQGAGTADVEARAPASVGAAPGAVPRNPELPKKHPPRRLRGQLHRLRSNRIPHLRGSRRTRLRITRLRRSAGDALKLCNHSTLRRDRNPIAAAAKKIPVADSRVAMRIGPSFSHALFCSNTKVKLVAVGYAGAHHRDVRIGGSLDQTRTMYFRVPLSVARALSGDLQELLRPNAQSL